MLCISAAYAVMRCLSVHPSVTFVHSVTTNKDIFWYFLHHRIATPFLFFHTKRHGSTLTGTPPPRALNAGGVCRNRDSEPIPGSSMACCEREVQYTQPRQTSESMTLVAGERQTSESMTLVAGERQTSESMTLVAGERQTSESVTLVAVERHGRRRRSVCQEASVLVVTPKTTEQHLIVRNGKWSEAEITIIKDCTRGSTLLKLLVLTDRKHVWPLCNSRATCILVA